MVEREENTERERERDSETEIDRGFASGVGVEGNSFTEAVVNG